MAKLNSFTLVTYNPASNYAAHAQHNARLLAGIKLLTNNGKQAITVANLVAWAATNYNNPQYINYGFNLKNNTIMPAPKGAVVITGHTAQGAVLPCPLVAAQQKALAASAAITAK